MKGEKFHHSKFSPGNGFQYLRMDIKKDLVVPTLLQVTRIRRANEFQFLRCRGLLSRPSSSFVFSACMAQAYGDSNGELSSSRNLYINNIPLEINDDRLVHIFSSYGEIDSARIMVDLTTRTSKGYGFVKFKTLESGMKIIFILFSHGKIVTCVYS
jgi:RNA recognition motif. (a.k.a. RRM, RBD, or RNP domain)